MSLDISLQWDRPASSGNSEHWLSVRLGGLPTTNGAQAIAVLLDTSTSMVGERLTQARAAVISLVKACQSSDRVAVFAFSSDVRRVAETQGGADIAQALASVEAGGKTCLGPALQEAQSWLTSQSGSGQVILITDGDPTNARGRRIPIEPLLEVARQLGVSGVRLTALGIGSTERYDAAFLRAFADAGGGNCLVDVPPDRVVSRMMAAVRQAVDEINEVTLSIDSAELGWVEAWRVAPRIQQLAPSAGSVTMRHGVGSVFLVRLQYRSALGARRGKQQLGTLSIRAGSACQSEPVFLELVGPADSSQKRLNPEVDRLRIQVELARTAELRAAAEEHEDQVRLTRRLSELAQGLGDPRATMRIDGELARLASGVILGKDERESVVAVLRGEITDG